MRTMFLSDLATVRPAVKQTLVTFLIVFLILLFCMAPEGAIAAVVVMIPYLFFYTLAVGDESSGWEKMRATLPMSRKQVVLGRYAVVGSLIVAAFVVALATGVAVMAIAGAIPNAPDWLARLAFSPERLGNAVASGVLGAACSLLFCAATLPFAFRFGITRSTRVYPILAVLAFVMASAFIVDQGIPVNLDAVSPVLICGVPLLGAIALCAVSMWASIRLYETREL